MTPMDLDLAEPARSAALDLAEAFPMVVFTSGRRSLRAQCEAMAENIVREKNWISETYAPSLPAAACQAWVNQQTTPLRAEGVTHGLLVVLSEFSNGQLEHLSKHLIGRAFDVRPISDAAGGSHMKQWLYSRAAMAGGKFLTHEGHLEKWHWEA